MRSQGGTIDLGDEIDDAASLGVDRNLGALSAFGPASHGFLAALPVCPLPSPVTACLVGRPHRAGRWFILPRPVSSSEFLRPCSRPFLSVGALPASGCSPSSRPLQMRGPVEGIAPASRFRPQVLSTSRRFVPLLVCRVAASAAAYRVLTARPEDHPPPLSLVLD